MSSAARGKACVSRKNAKPNYVKKLNFGEPSVNSNTNLLSTNTDLSESIGNNSLYTSNLTQESLTAKEQFVRQWIENQDESTLSPLRNDHFSFEGSSPILGSSATKCIERSPVFGNIKKRTKNIVDLNYSAEDEKNITYISAQDSTNQDILNDVFCEDQNLSQNECTQNADLRHNIYSQIKSFSDKCSIVTENKSASNSPSLDKSYAYKRRKRKLVKDQQESALQESTWIDRKSYNTLDDIISTQNIKSEIYVSPPKKYPKTEEASFKNEMKQEFSESICILDINPPLCSQKKLEILESPVSIKSNVKLNIEPCDGLDKEESKEKFNISSSDSDKTITNLIEDDDSQDIVPLQKFSSTSTASLLSTCNHTLKSSITSTIDSDETFCSRAEDIIRAEKLNAETPQKIVQTPSLNSDTQKSSQADIIISLCPSPPKVVTDALTLNSLDSGKKRKKPRKGTIADRLQSLVSRQVSCIHIWRHQMINTADSTSLQYVTVQVQRCSLHYGRQFLEGFIIEDRHNLLRDYNGTRILVDGDVQEPLPKRTYTGVTIMTVPSLIGKIQMRAEGAIKIYPPWEILDSMKTIINVMYLSIVPPDETNNILITGLLSTVKKRSSEEFNCPCIESGVFSVSCEIHKKMNKPNPMMHLFK